MLLYKKINTYILMNFKVLKKGLSYFQAFDVSNTKPIHL